MEAQMVFIKLSCFCGNENFKTLERDDGNSENTYLSTCVICPICIANNGEFNKSPYWKEPNRDDKPVLRTKKEMGKVPRL
jgi:hypothetical protein